jgi:hypothetical protein
MRLLPLLALAALLTGCPEERPGAQRQVPVQRVPPAVAIEPLGDGGPLQLIGEAGGVLR